MHKKKTYSILWIIFALAIGGYSVKSFMDNKAKQKTEKIEANRSFQATAQARKATISQFVLRTNAVDDWESRLLAREKEFRILTVDLEKLWLQERPILFEGTIEDIATYSQSDYMVLIEMWSVGGAIKVSLVSKKEKIDSFLLEHPNVFKSSEDKNGVAAVARIKAIRTVEYSDENGDRVINRIGEGELVDIIYTGWSWFEEYIHKAEKHQN